MTLTTETAGWLMLLAVAAYGFMIAVFTSGLASLAGKKRRHERPEATAGGATSVSVIIPARNEAHNIPRLLEDIGRQDFPLHRLEVIVSDDQSEDGTPETARRFGEMHPGFPLQVVTAGLKGADGRGKKRAIERAVAASTGGILLFTDADTFRGDRWISSMVEGFEKKGVVMVLGPVSFTREKNLIQKIQSLEFMGLMGVTAGSAAGGYPVMCNGANLAYRREAFGRTRGFESNIQFPSGDDQFMLSRIRRIYGKGSIVFNPDPAATVGTVPEKTLAGFVNQRMRWVSKSRGYRDPVVIVAGAVTYLAHFLLLAGLLWGFFSPAILAYTVPLWLLKILLDYPAVAIMMRFLGKRKLSRYYFIAQVFQLVYVPVVGVLGLFLPYKWKGRKG